MRVMQSALNSSVFDKVVLAVAQAVYIAAPGLSQSTRLVDDLALSRFGRLKLALSLEELFDVELQDDAIDRFSTLGDIVSYLSCRYFRDIEPSAPTLAA
jgi:acyl carrier protein